MELKLGSIWDGVAGIFFAALAEKTFCDCAKGRISNGKKSAVRIPLSLNFIH